MSLKMEVGVCILGVSENNHSKLPLLNVGSPQKGGDYEVSSPFHGPLSPSSPVRASKELGPKSELSLMAAKAHLSYSPWQRLCSDA